MIVARIFQEKRSIPFFSFLIGLGLAVLLFHKPFQTNPTLAMPVAEVEKQVVKQDGKCYKYVAEDSQCEILPSK